MKIRCSICGADVSSELPDDTEVEAFVECQNCRTREEAQNKSDEIVVTTHQVVDLPPQPEPKVSFTAQVISRSVVEQTYMETNYESLVQRLLDATRMRKNKLPITIVISQD